MERLSQPLSIGERLRMRRMQYKLSREVVAGLVGRSAEWLRQVESGKARLDSLTVIRGLAEALHISDIRDLIEEPGPAVPSTLGPDPRLLALRRAVIDRCSVLAFGGTASPRGATWASVQTELDHTWSRWCTGADRYSYAMGRLPALLYTARALCRRQGADPDAERVLGGSYRLARSLLTRLGEHELALHAAHRALDLAEQVADPLAVAAGAWHVAGCLLQLGHHAEAVGFATAAADNLASEAGTSDLADPTDRERVAMTGALRTTAAEADAAQLNAAGCASSLTLAQAAATALGTDMCSRGVWFGPTEIGIAELQIALRLGRIADALRQSRTLEVPAEYPVERRSRYLVSLAVAHAHRGEDAAVLLALSQAERECPEDLRFDQTARNHLARLIRRDNRSMHSEVSRLAVAAGL
ncbi:helix-turn-helix domain-containing protein [Catenulispora rubra]|uniref:helix-turn-helix domain-containing protein n=1 Tax=Catenulispora rubra TaxID=280293 RepID=UPI001E4747F8|nr:helix-turn-helix transcriptional regulator [Catenulispora rubra]